MDFHFIQLCRLLIHAFVQDDVDFQSEVLNSVGEYGAWIERVSFL